MDTAQNNTPISPIPTTIPEVTPTNTEVKVEKVTPVETIQTEVEKAPEVSTISSPTSPQDNTNDATVSTAQPIIHIVDKTTPKTQTQDIQTTDKLSTKADKEEKEFIEDIISAHEHN